MKFRLNGSQELPAQKKRVLAIGGVAFIILIFISFLLSLTEDESQDIESSFETGTTIVQDDLNGSLPLPSSQRYDFESNGQSVGGGLENLLNDTPPVGVDNDPFADNKNNQSETVEENTVAPGPADEVPEYEELQAAVKLPKETALYCDSYSTSAAAESQKAVLAFQGISASVINNQDNSFGLKLGPYENADQARKAFNELSEKGLLQRCALITK